MFLCVDFRGVALLCKLGISCPCFSMASISTNEEFLTVTCGLRTHIINIKSSTHESIDHSDVRFNKPISDSSSVQCTDGYEEQGLCVLSSEISQCGNLLAFCTYSKNLIVINIKDNNSMHSIYRLLRGASKIKFTPVSKNIIVADKSGDVYLFDLKTQNDPGTLILGHLSLLLDVLVTSDEQLIITCDRDEKIRVSSFPNGYNIVCYCLGHTEFVSSMLFLPNLSNYLVSTSGDGTIRFWNFKVGEELMTCNTFKYLRSSNEESQKDEDIAAITDASAVQVDGLTSLICASVDFFNTCLVFKCTYEESELRCDLTQKIPLDEFSPSKVDFSAGTLWMVLNYKEILSAKAFSFNSEKTVFEETVPDEVGKALNVLNNLKLTIDAKKNIVNLLFKRKFDNVQDYLERKEARIALQESTNKKLKSAYLLVVFL